MNKDDSLSNIVQHYADADEASRLRTGWFQLEQERTKELILRHLPPPPAKVIDAGGGAGAYACWLAQRGYEVHLIDPVANTSSKPAPLRRNSRFIRWLLLKSATLAASRTLKPAPMRSCC